MNDKRGKQPRGAAERAELVREAAVRAEHAARRLLRRTRSLARHASRRLPLSPPSALPDPGPTGDHSALVLPTPPQQTQPAAWDAPELHELADEIALLRARLERSEAASAWLRARLRAERLRRAVTPRLDAAGLAADLARDLARLRAHDDESIGRAVRRVLAAHGLPAPPLSPRDTPGTVPPTLPGWSREDQDAVAAQVLAHAPEVSSPFYVHRALALVAAHGRGTLAQLTRASGFDSAMGRRRLRLAIDGLVALGALVARDGAYLLNTEYRPQPQPIPRSRPPQHRRPGGATRG